MPLINGEEFIYVRHKDHGDDVMPGLVSRTAYDMIHAGKGFVIVDSVEAELMASPPTMAERQAASTEPASEPDTEPVPATTGSRKKG